VTKRQQPAGDRSEHLQLARHLRDAILECGKEKSHTAADIARALDVSLGHWYRLRKDPDRFTNIEFRRARCVATYVGWPVAHVLVAIGWVLPGELGEDFSSDAVLDRALKRLMREAVTQGVTTPLKTAARDHQVLLARLFLAAEATAVNRSIQKL
jgi:hypothetical protein